MIFIDIQVSMPKTKRPDNSSYVRQRGISVLHTSIFISNIRTLFVSFSLQSYHFAEEYCVYVLQQHFFHKCRFHSLLFTNKLCMNTQNYHQIYCHVLCMTASKILPCLIHDSILKKFLIRLTNCPDYLQV